jgi:hypothetical protein
MPNENPKNKAKKPDLTKFSYERPEPKTDPPIIEPISLTPPEPPKPKPKDPESSQSNSSKD